MRSTTPIRPRSLGAALLACCGAPMALAAPPFPASIEMGTLAAPTGVTLNGNSGLDRAGVSVCALGDVNGDGIDDIAIGAPYSDLPSRIRAGCTLVVFGAPGLGDAGPIDLTTLDGTTGFTINGAAAEDRSGSAVSSCGDFNGDGFDDILIGAYSADPAGRSEAGVAYILFGGPTIGSSGAIELSALTAATGIVITGAAAGDNAGWSVAGCGDVNGDTHDDVIIGARYASPGGRAEAGAAHVVFGGPGAGASGIIDLGALMPSEGVTINGNAPDEHAGWSVAGAGDVNADGAPDLLIGARYADPSGLKNAGEVFIVFGAPGLGASGPIECSTLAGTLGMRIQGGAAGDRAGVAVDGAGDINGDGVDDILIGSYLSDFGGHADAGGVYVVFGSPTIGAGSGVLPLWSIDGTNGFVIIGKNAADTAGGACAGAGDVNGDGHPDIILGAALVYRDGHFGVGEAYTVFGGPGVGSAGYVAIAALDGVSGFTMLGATYRDFCGTAVSGAGDVNSDGIDDLFVSATGADPDGHIDAGQGYIIFGRAPACAGDINFDGSSNAADFTILAGNFGGSVPPNTSGDLNGDGIVNAADFVILAGDFGCGAP